MYTYYFEIPRQRLSYFLDSLPEAAENIKVTDSPRGAQFLKTSADMDRAVWERWFINRGFI